MRRWIFGALGVLLVLVACELALLVAARLSPRVDYLLTPPWRRIAVDDPALRVRGSAFAPGHDTRGFRNLAVPSEVDVVAVGDSMTYGYAAAAEDSWPRQLERQAGWSVYNMSFGGYCPWQYALLAREGLALDPAWVVVGLFIGNEFSETYRDVWLGGFAERYRSDDPEVAAAIRNADADETLGERAKRLIGSEQGGDGSRESTSMRTWLSEGSALYGLARELKSVAAGERWDNQRRDTFEAAGQRPHRIAWDADPRFRTVFLRPEALAMRVDSSDPRIGEGVRIVQEILVEMRAEIEAAGARLAVVLIPSKQVVYEELVRRSGEQLPATFWRLIDLESELTREFQEFLDQHDFVVVDTRPALRAKFDQGIAPYPEWDDEHPNAAGYGAIAEEVSRTLGAERGPDWELDSTERSRDAGVG
jgi:hypothetical protein